MNYVLAVQVVDSDESFSYDVPDDSFIEGLVEASLEHLSEAAGIHILQEDPESVLEEIAFIVPDDIGMVANGHQSDLVAHLVLLLGVVHGPIDELEGIFDAGLLAFLRDEVYLPVASLPEKLLDAVVQCWIVVFKQVLVLY